MIGSPIWTIALRFVSIGPIISGKNMCPIAVGAPQDDWDTLDNKAMVFLI